MNARQVRRGYQAARIILLLALLCALVLLSGCDTAEGPRETPGPQEVQEKQPQYGFIALVKEITDTTMRVEVYYSTDELKEGTTLTLSTDTYSESSLDDVWVGNLVRVVMADPIEDTAELVVPLYIEREYTQPR